MPSLPEKVRVPNPSPCLLYTDIPYWNHWKFPAESNLNLHYGCRIGEYTTRVYIHKMQVTKPSKFILNTGHTKSNTCL